MLLNLFAQGDHDRPDQLFVIIGMLFGDLGGQFIITDHIFRQIADSVGLRRSEGVDFGSPLDRCHDCSPVEGGKKGCRE
ncbi:MAG: hypothetical protein D3924_10805 [Candidatus Electrothrix sp. AR4]|nr:hypothetical protein [Candidatus Electrothrix sp. AR4]